MITWILGVSKGKILKHRDIHLRQDFGVTGKDTEKENFIEKILKDGIYRVVNGYGSLKKSVGKNEILER